MKHTKGLKQSLESQKIHEPALFGFKKEKINLFLYISQH